MNMSVGRIGSVSDRPVNSSLRIHLVARLSVVVSKRLFALVAPELKRISNSVNIKSRICFMLYLYTLKFGDTQLGLPNGVGFLELKGYCVFLTGVHFLMLNRPDGDNASLNKLTTTTRKFYSSRKGQKFITNYKYSFLNGIYLHIFLCCLNTLLM